MPSGTPGRVWPFFDQSRWTWFLSAADRSGAESLSDAGLGYAADVRSEHPYEI
jgi:hypothetical protein